MRSKSILLFYTVILFTSCAAPTQQATAHPSDFGSLGDFRSLDHDANLHANIHSNFNAYTPEPALPPYGVIDPNIGEKLKAEDE
ncbi:MAG: hypothetical protein U0V48_07020 [Anaerolineales bacterium]